MIKVSVVVPVYNVENYIEKCLNSLVNQTLEEIEIIIVNDGSTDNSENIIKKYSEKYFKKIKYLIKENGGLSDARNYGIKYATGEYIAFLDSDDYVSFDLYEKMYNKAIECNADYVECDFIWKYDDRELNDIGYVYKDKKEMMIFARVVAWNKLIKRQIVVDNKIEFPKGLRYEDIEFFYKIMPYIKSFSFVKEPLIYYSQRGDSIINTQNERTRDIFIVLKNVINYYKEKELYEKYKDELEYIYIRLLLCSSFLRIVKIKNKKLRNKLLKETWYNLNNEFPLWKKNLILRKYKTKKNMYIRSINKITFKLYSAIFRIK
ncbi:MAG: glycosyltransferase [Clostridiales bacterium]|nr:glycosyltransferase [Clostridiales bacterium]